jgi:hypothetical protein
VASLPKTVGAARVNSVAANACRLDKPATLSWMRAELTTVSDLEPFVAAYCAANLCRPSSEMQNEIYVRQADTPIVVVQVELPIAWVASHEWRDQQTLEAFVAPERRRRGLVKLGAHMLLAAGHLVKTEPIAVFSPDCVPLARSLGFAEVRHYTRNGKDWVLHLG